MRLVLIASALGFLGLSACSAPPTQAVYVPVDRPALVVPTATPIETREVSWIVVTDQNRDEVFNSLSDPQVLFAVSPQDYERLSLNLNDIRAYVQQQQQIIAAYRRYYTRADEILAGAETRITGGN